MRLCLNLSLSTFSLPLSSATSSDKVTHSGKKKKKKKERKKKERKKEREKRSFVLRSRTYETSDIHLHYVVCKYRIFCIAFYTLHKTLAL